MQIDIITVGNLKEKYIKEAKNDYVKRLSKFVKINEIEIKDQNNSLSKEEVLKKEYEDIIKKLNKKTYLIVLAIEGKQLSSEDFSKRIDKLQISGVSHITFLIGGSYGVAKELKDEANYLLSFSKFTFPHQLFRVILLEQIYRSFKILNNQTYHK